MASARHRRDALSASRTGGMSSASASASLTVIVSDLMQRHRRPSLSHRCTAIANYNSMQRVQRKKRRKGAIDTSSGAVERLNHNQGRDIIRAPDEGTDETAAAARTFTYNMKSPSASKCYDATI